jgi:hypothetical protein
VHELGITAFQCMLQFIEVNCTKLLIHITVVMVYKAFRFVAGIN